MGEALIVAGFQKPDHWDDHNEWIKICNAIKGSKYHYRVDFLKWLMENPVVWAEFKRKVNRAYLNGHKTRFNSRALLEVIRWETMVSEREKTFKINNNFAADLARLAMEVAPHLRGYFQTRNSSIRGDS